MTNRLSVPQPLSVKWSLFLGLPHSFSAPREEQYLRSSAMRAAALLLLLEIASEAAAECSKAASCFQFSAFRGRVIIAAYRGQTVAAGSEIDCVVSLCSGSQSTCCAVSFNRRTGECVRATRSDQVIAAALDASTDANSEWSTFLPTGQPEATAQVNFGPSLEPPSALWMLDADSKGRNLGSKGALLDMNEAGLTSWNTQGPPGAALKKKFVRLDASNAATIQNLHCGAHVLDFSGNFSIAAWVKTDDVTGPMSILEGGPYPHQSLRFVSDNQDQLEFRTSSKDYYISTKDSIGRLQWRHITAVYGGDSDKKIYQSGTLLERKKTSLSPKVSSYRPDSYAVGRGNGSSRFFGSMACLSIYERALSQKDVNLLMNLCP